MPRSCASATKANPCWATRRPMDGEIGERWLILALAFPRDRGASLGRRGREHKFASVRGVLGPEVALN